MLSISQWEALKPPAAILVHLTGINGIQQYFNEMFQEQDNMYLSIFL